MTLARITGWLGFIALLAGAVRMLMTPASLIWGTDSLPELAAGYAGCVLMAIGSIGLMLGQSQKAGIWGFIGSLLMAVGNIFTSSLVWTTLFKTITEPSQTFLMINNIVMLLGFVIFSLISIRVNVYPRWASILLLVSPLISMIPMFGDYFALMWGLAYVAFGYQIWKART
ncbi:MULTISPECIES: hypothetical protein [unclassified Paenibacillus]|uniref:hypothetical protein n=1 Tax=unclassified Paenibacillus TaxID=185978 RepID=UPI003639866B